MQTLLALHTVGYGWVVRGGWRLRVLRGEFSALTKFSQVYLTNSITSWPPRLSTPHPPVQPLGKGECLFCYVHVLFNKLIYETSVTVSKALLAGQGVLHLFRALHLLSWCCLKTFVSSPCLIQPTAIWQLFAQFEMSPDMRKLSGYESVIHYCINISK